MDFTNCKRIITKAYSGANGKKIAVELNGKQYMLKFPPSGKNKPTELSYTNSCYSEHIGSSIFNMVGIKAQKTMLGTFEVGGKEKIVCACEDFTADEKGISIYRIPVLIKAIINKSSIFTGEDKSGFFSISAFSMVRYKVEELFTIIKDEKERYLLFNDILENANINTLPFISDFINGRELAYGRLTDDKIERGEKLFSLEQLQEIEKNFMKKLKLISENICLLDISNSTIILYLYESFDAESFKIYMDSILKDDMNKLKYLTLSVEKWTSGSRISWRINNNYKKFLDDNTVNTALKKAVDDKTILSLLDEDLHRVIAFTLKDEIDMYGSIEDKDVIERIKEIKHII